MASEVTAPTKNGGDDTTPPKSIRSRPAEGSGWPNEARLNGLHLWAAGAAGCLARVMAVEE
jgi:hypothetical protein